MRVYFIAVKGDHPDGEHDVALTRAMTAVQDELGHEAVVRAWMEEMLDPADDQRSTARFGPTIDPTPLDGLKREVERLERFWREWAR